MTRPSHASLGTNSTCALPVNAERLSRSLPVVSLTVKPSRSTCANDTPRLTLSFTTGPDAPPRTAHEPWLPNGADSVPLHPESDGRAVEMLTRPPSVLRPNNALCGPRTNSIWFTSSSSMLEEFALSCGTPSMNVVMPGLFGLELMPRKRALLNLRADHSVKNVLGAKIAASLTI